MMPIDVKFVPPQEGLYLVGGSLRDCLLGRTPKDYDLVVKQNPQKTARQIANTIHGRPVTLGKGRRQIVRVVSREYMVDISSLKGLSIEENLSGRDFTINAMAYDIASRQIIDVSHGLQDLENKRVRMVSERVFQSDPVRLLRAFRIAAVLDFNIDPATLAAIAENASRIKMAAGERVKAELLQIFAVSDSFSIIKRMIESGLIFQIFPEFESMQNCHQNRHHGFSVLEHTLRTYRRMEVLMEDVHPYVIRHADRLRAAIHPQRRPLLKFAALLHDVGKPSCRLIDRKGDFRFLGHEAKGSQMAAEIGRRLRLSNKERDYLKFMVANHLRPLLLFLARRNHTLSRRGIARFFLKSDGFTMDILLLAMADMQAKQDHPSMEAGRFMEFVNFLLDRYFATFQSALQEAPLITGQDLMDRLKLKPSPIFKIILATVREQRLAGKITTKQEALDLARDIAKKAHNEITKQKS